MGLRPTRAALLSLAAIVPAILVSPASAFDGSRRGFLLGIGFGGGASTIEDQNGASIRNVSRAGVTSDFEIGRGKSERLLIYYANRVLWLSQRDRLGLTGLGLRRYLGDAGGFADVTLGLSSWSGRLGNTIGLGASLALGWEAFDHWLLRGSVLYADSGLRTHPIQPRGSAGTLCVTWLRY